MEETEFTSKQIVEFLKQYFDAKVFGSANIKSLEINDINDIDVCVSNTVYAKVMAFLQNNGYSDKDIQHYTENGYKAFFGANNKFTKKGQLLIHLLADDDFNVWDESQIIASKIKRNSESDKKQLKIIISKL